MSALRHVRGAPACGSGTAGVLVQYAEEPKEGGYPLAGRAVGAQRTPDDCGTAVDTLCIIPAQVQRHPIMEVRSPRPQSSIGEG